MYVTYSIFLGKLQKYLLVPGITDIIHEVSIHFHMGTMIV